jgi:hypothetical protein
MCHGICPYLESGVTSSADGYHGSSFAASDFDLLKNARRHLNAAPSPSLVARQDNDDSCPRDELLTVSRVLSLVIKTPSLREWADEQAL